VKLREEPGSNTCQNQHTCARAPLPTKALDLPVYEVEVLAGGYFNPAKVSRWHDKAQSISQLRSTGQRFLFAFRTHRVGRSRHFGVGVRWLVKLTDSFLELRYAL